MKEVKLKGKQWKKQDHQLWVKPSQGTPLQIQPDAKGRFSIPDNIDPLLFEVRDKYGALVSCVSTQALNTSENLVDIDLDDVNPIILKRLQKLDRILRMKQQAKDFAERFQQRFTADKEYICPVAQSNPNELKKALKDQLSTQLNIGKSTKTIKSAYKISAANWNRINEITEGSGKADFEQLIPFLDPAIGNGKPTKLSIDSIAALLDKMEGEVPNARSTADLVTKFIQKQEKKGTAGLIKRMANLNNAAEEDDTLDPCADPEPIDNPSAQSASHQNQLSTLLTNLINHWNRFENGISNRLDPQCLRKSLRDNTIEGAPSDNAAIYDYHSIRVALPNTWCNYFVEELYRDLLTKYKEAWEKFQDDLAWHIPKEISATAQIEDLLSITDELGLESQVIQQLHAFGIYITERDYIALDERTRSKAFVYIARYNALTDIETDEEINKYTIEEENGLRRTWMEYPGNPLTSPILKESRQYYVQLSESVDTLFSGEEGFEPGISFITQTVDGKDVEERPADNQYPILYNVILPADGVESKITDTRFVLRVSTYQLVLQRLINHIVISALEEKDEQTNDDGDIRLDETTVSSSIEALSKFLTQDRLPFGRTIDGFDIFAPRSVNFGIALKYSQVWMPFGYQAGDLVKTLPLAPGETRKFKTKTVVKKTRKSKEQDAAISIIGDQSQTTGRVESEVIKKAQNSQSFSTHAEASGEVGMLSFGGSADTNNTASKDASRTRKNLREAVSKASQEFKSERKMEVEAFESTTSEQETTGEISNPNNEIVVTYLFYELQRRFMVLDALTGIQHVVLVAAKVPRPSEVTESFLIQYDWILRRVLLDDSYNEVFDIIQDTQKSRQVEVGVRKLAVERQLEALRETKEQLRISTRVRDQAISRINSAMSTLSDVTLGTGVADSALNVLTGGLFGMFGGSNTEGVKEAFEVQNEAAQEALQRIDREINRLRTRLEANTSALEQAIEAYAKVVRETLRREQQVLRGRVHVAQNILYYMQAIWKYQYKDQRYFELFDIEVPIITGETSCEGEEDSGGNIQVDISVDVNGDINYQQLHEIADLDTLIGFFGNYLIFPMKECNPLTHRMASDYQDEVISEILLKIFPMLGSANSRGITIIATMLLVFEFFVDDPDGFIEFLEDIFGVKDINQADELKAFIAYLGKIGWQIVSIPSGHTHIEALPGKHPVLEDFKLKHRMHDMRMAEAESIIKQIESIRHLMRVQQENLADPDVDKRVEIHGNGNFMVDTE